MKALPFFAVAFGLLAIVVALTNSGGISSTDSGLLAAERSATDARLLILEKGLMEFNQRLQQLQDDQLLTSVSNRVPVKVGAESTTALDTLALESILERLRSLEGVILTGSKNSSGLDKESLTLEGDTGGPGTSPGTVTVGRFGRTLTPEQLLASQLKATNPNSTPKEKLEALKYLRGNQDELGDARNRDVVLSMIDLIETSKDASTREDVYRQLSGVTEPALRKPLINSLTNDQDAGVREEAAETLEGYLPDPDALAALRYSAQYDASDDVRKQAQKVLSSAGYN